MDNDIKRSLDIYIGDYVPNMRPFSGRAVCIRIESELTGYRDQTGVLDEVSQWITIDTSGNVQITRIYQNEDGLEDIKNECVTRIDTDRASEILRGFKDLFEEPYSAPSEIKKGQWSVLMVNDHEDPYVYTGYFSDEPMEHNISNMIRIILQDRSLLLLDGNPLEDT